MSRNSNLSLRDKRRIIGARNKSLHQAPGPVRHLSDDERKAYEAELLARDGTPR